MSRIQELLLKVLNVCNVVGWGSAAYSCTLLRIVRASPYRPQISSQRGLPGMMERQVKTMSGQMSWKAKEMLQLDGES